MRLPGIDVGHLVDSDDYHTPPTPDTPPTGVPAATLHLVPGVTTARGGLSRPDSPPQSDQPCRHPRAAHRCGTHARYVLDKCRCDPCRAANTAYEKRRSLWTREFPYTDPPLVAADEARRIVQHLEHAGYSLKRVAKVSGISHGALSKLVYGSKERGPSRRVRRETLQKLRDTLDAAEWDEVTVADGCQVPADEAKGIVAELVARGWAKAEIGRRVTGNSSAQSLQAVRGQRVQASTLRTLRELMCEPVPDRVHNPTGKLYRPNPSRRPKAVPRTTPHVGGPEFAPPLTAGERIMSVLTDIEGWWTATALAARCGIAESTIRTLLPRLLRSGRIERRDSPGRDSTGEYRAVTT